MCVVLMGSPFARQSVSDPIPIPWDPPHTIVVRRLTGREEEAAAVAHRENVASANPRSWPAILRHMLEHGASDAEVRRVLADPLLGYDRYVLARLGLVAWSYPESLTPIAATAAVEATATTPASPAAPAYDPIEECTGDLVDFVARAVLRRTKPALFLTAEEDVATAQKELSGSAPAA